MRDTFICAVCGEEHEKGNDGEAFKEKERLFPDTSIEEYSVVCDDCFDETTGSKEIKIRVCKEMVEIIGKEELENRLTNILHESFLKYFVKEE